MEKASRDRLRPYAEYKRKRIADTESSTLQEKLFMHAYVKSIQVPRLPHSAHLSELENRSVNKLASRELRQQETPIGIFSDGYPTWMWQIGTLGRVKWMVSQHNPSIRATEDPPWISRSSSPLCLEGG